MQNAKLKKQNFKREFSAGCVVFKKIIIRNSKLTIRFLLGKHSGYHKWVLPKGLIEKGEKGWQTAIRETEEEMAVKARPISRKPIQQIQYVYYADLKNNIHSQSIRRVQRYQEQGARKTKVFKSVNFYLAEYVSGDPQNHGWEMSEASWFSFKEAHQKLAFPGEREALKQGWKMIKKRKKRANVGAWLLSLAQEAEKLKIKGPKDLSLTIDSYLY